MLSHPFFVGYAVVLDATPGEFFAAIFGSTLRCDADVLFTADVSETMFLCRDKTGAGAEARRTLRQRCRDEPSVWRRDGGAAAVITQPDVTAARRRAARHSFCRDGADVAMLLCCAEFCRCAYAMSAIARRATFNAHYCPVRPPRAVSSAGDAAVALRVYFDTRRAAEPMSAAAKTDAHAPPPLCPPPPHEYAAIILFAAAVIRPSRWWRRWWRQYSAT